MGEDKRLRHPKGGGYARGEETRQRIIEAAIAVFGERGFTAATTREIAMRADVNPPALQYYFENKEGVYHACAEHMSSTAMARFAPVIEVVDAKLAAGVEGEAAAALFCLLQDALIDHMLGSGDMRARHLFMAREQAGHGGPDMAMEKAKNQVSQKVNGAGAAILARISGLDASSEEIRLRTLMLFGQVLIFHVGRPGALLALGWSDFDAEKVSILKKTLHDQTYALLRGWVR